MSPTPTEETGQIRTKLDLLNDTLASLHELEGGKKKPVKESTPKTPPPSPEEIRLVADAVSHTRKEIAKIVVGQDEAVTLLLCALLSNGHVLLEALPGTAKTLLIRALAKASGCEFSRIQFTVDLLPTDITGITTYDPKQESFTTLKGPIFAHFVLGDEINRAPPKTQSALLEAMQERQVTIADKTYVLPSPFFVMATQNPIENAGTYKLPEAQIDRFLFKVIMDYPTKDEERHILSQNITLQNFESFSVKPALDPEKIIAMQKLAIRVHVSPDIEEYIVRIVNTTRQPTKAGLKNAKFIRYGSSPRASIGLYIASKAMALLRGQGFVTPHHVQEIAPYVLRHRLLLNYEAEIENVTPEMVIKEIIQKTPLP